MSNPSAAEDPSALPEGVSVVVPCFNSEATLGPLVSQLADVLPTCAPAYEVILVNDDSRDGTWETIGSIRW